VSDSTDHDPAQALNAQLEAFRTALEAVEDASALYDLQVRFIGKKGSVSLLRKQMGKQMAQLSADEKKAFGQAFNEVKLAIEGEIEARRETLAQRARQRDLGRVEDLTMPPSQPPTTGTLHPITATRRKLEGIFRKMGFSVVEGPHVEDELYNFDKLNFQAGHPARDMQDTFFVDPRPGATEGSDAAAGGLVLRTHTSPVQVRTMLRHDPPIRVVAPGTVFRRDDDATHSPMFHQLEGLYVDRGVTMADLKHTLYRFVGELFGEGLELRLRPSYFPFVEPGAEVDMQCPFCRDPATGTNAGCGLCKQTGFIEIAGSGMVHPAVFEACGYDPEVYTGWAFGLGIDRMAMLLHAVKHLRLFFDGDVRFLEQYTC